MQESLAIAYLQAANYLRLEDNVSLRKEDPYTVEVFWNTSVYIQIQHYKL